MIINGKANCELTLSEQRRLDKAVAIIEQLAFHYRNTDIGSDYLDTVSFLSSVLSDNKLCGRDTPAPNKAEQEADDADAMLVEREK